MQAIILAGGFGTRLQSVVKDVPKPMAPIHGKPFLAYLLDYLQSQGVKEVILSVHYLREQIENFFQNQYHAISISYAVEDKPLGTGGAILKSLELVKSQEPVFVLNGDTFLKVNYHSMFSYFKSRRSEFTMALRKVPDCSRYGRVLLDENLKAHEFQENGGDSPGLINAGAYLFNPNIFSNHRMPEKFSFERDFLFPKIAEVRPHAFEIDDYFIDIGIPEDYERAKMEFADVV